MNMDQKLFETIEPVLLANISQRRCRIGKIRRKGEEGSVWVISV